MGTNDGGLKLMLPTAVGTVQAAVALASPVSAATTTSPGQLRNVGGYVSSSDVEPGVLNSDPALMAVVATATW